MPDKHEKKLAGEIVAPVVSGSGVLVVHRQLESHLHRYRVRSMSPYWGILPQSVALMKHTRCAVTHSLPELGAHIAHPDSTLIVTFHNYYLDDEMMAISSFAQRTYYRHVLEKSVRAALRRAKLATAVSRFTADIVQRHHALGDRLLVIRNGVDTELFSPAKDIQHGKVRILFAGNPTRRKGVEHLAQLAAVLPSNAVLQYTAGLRSSGVEKIKALDRLQAIPRRAHHEMPKIYRDADILFFPTRREGLSLVVLEAMACGLPVVATRCSSMPELIEHGKGGFLFDMDNRSQMLDYLQKLASDPVLRGAMGAYNREKVLTEFTLNGMLESYRDLFSFCGIDT